MDTGLRIIQLCLIIPYWLFTRNSTLLVKWYVYSLLLLLLNTYLLLKCTILFGYYETFRLTIYIKQICNLFMAGTLGTSYWNHKIPPNKFNNMCVGKRKMYEILLSSWCYSVKLPRILQTPLQLLKSNRNLPGMMETFFKSHLHDSNTIKLNEENTWCINSNTRANKTNCSLAMNPTNQWYQMGRPLCYYNWKIVEWAIALLSHNLDNARSTKGKSCNAPWSHCIS